MRARPFLILSLFILAAARSETFWPSIHGELTEEALQSVEFLPGVKFTQPATLEVSAADRAVDTGDCSGQPTALAQASLRTASAVPCTTAGAEEIAGLVRNNPEGPDVHFDSEQIEAGHQRIQSLRLDITRLLYKRQSVGARWLLGSVLHSLQDFYSHTNWVELGHTDLEPRLALSGFLSGLPKVAGRFDSTCTFGTSVLIQKVTGPSLAALNGPPVYPRPADALLTSGYYPNSVAEILNHRGDSDVPPAKRVNKCSHGGPIEGPDIDPATIHMPPIGTPVVRGINKDTIEWAGVTAITTDVAGPTAASTPWLMGGALDEQKRHETARDLGMRQSVKFVRDLIGAPELASRRDLVLGLMGYEPRITRFGISQVPPPPGADFWDGVVASLFMFWTVHPDIETCIITGGVRNCAPVCEDTDTANPDRHCIQPIGSGGLWLPATGGVGVEVWDVDAAGRQLMARGTISVSDPCLSTKPGTDRPPCELKAERGPLLISFDIPGTCTNEFKPACSPWPTFELPLLPPGPGGVTPAPVAPSGPTVTPPAAPAPAASPAAAPGARTLTVAAARTPENIDALLRLRDADNCIGGDTFFPAGDALGASTVGRRLGPDQTNRLYQATALLTAVTDPTAKQNLMTAITSRADGGDLIDVMNALGPVQGQAIVQGYQTTMKSFAGQVTSTGLTQLLAPARSPAALETEVSRWIAKRLATAPLASEAVDRILTSPIPVSAECTINELAKGGFTDVVNGL